MLRSAIPLLAALLIAVGGGVADARVAFTSARGVTAKGARIMVANDDGSGSVALGIRGSNVRISPDGTRLAYVAGAIDEGTTLRIRTIDTGAEIVVAAAFGSASPNAALWSPDGTRLLMPTDSSTADGYITGEGLDIVDAATGAVTVVVPPKGNEVTGFSWSPTGAEFAYATHRWAGRLFDETIRIASADGTAVRTVGRGTNPLWGPTRIAFQRYTRERWRGTTVYHAELWLSDPVAQLTRYDAKGLIYGPWAGIWSPDGTRLYGGIGGQDYSLPGRVNATTGRFTAYRDAKGHALQDAYPAAISADGATLLMRTGAMLGREQVQLMPASGGALRAYIPDVLELSVTPSWQP
jgi:hypothetical protein